MILLLAPTAALIILALKVAHDKREHDRALYDERERFDTWVRTGVWR